MKLQLLAQELNNSIEDASTRAVGSVPRALREIERLRRESASLKDGLGSIVQNVEEIEEKTHSAVRLIALLDQTKARMISTSRLLHQATRVQAFRRDVDSIFATDDHELIADNICEARETAQALISMQEFKGFDQELDILSDKLVDAMQEPLNAAIVARDAEAAQKYTDVLRKIGRESKIRSLYVSLRRKPFMQFWESHVVATADAAPFGDRLSAFFENTLRTLKEETTWLIQAFPSEIQPRGLACALLSDCLRSLSGDFAAHLEAAIAESKLKRLTEYHALAMRFYNNVQTALNGSEDGDIDDVSLAIFEPFFKYEDGFSSLLQSELGTPPPVKKLFGDVVRAIDDEVRRLFLGCEAAVDACLKFSGGALASSLLSVLNDSLSQYAAHLESIISRARAVMNLPELPTVQSSSINLKIPDDKWGRFQLAMLLAQASFNGAKRLSAFELHMREKLRQVRDVLLEGTAVALNEGEASRVQVGLLHMLANTERLRNLRALLNSLDDTHFKLLGGASRRFGQIHGESVRFVFDVMFAPIHFELERYASIPEWNVQPEASEYDNVDLPTFSLSPSPPVTAIGEYMISLPQQLEPFEESGFPIDVNVLGGDVDVTGFGAQWLSLLAMRTAGDYVVKLLDINSATDTGRKQMLADVGYIANVLTAVGMPSMPALGQLSKLLGAVDVDDYQLHVKNIVTAPVPVDDAIPRVQGQRDLTSNEISRLGQIIGM